MRHEIRMAIEYREDESRQSPGILSGVLIRYGETSPGHQERFVDGSLSWPETGIVIREQHNRQAPILRTVPTVEGAEVRISASLPNTTRGRDAAENIRGGLFRGLSVEFIPEEETYTGDVREIRKAKLVGAGLVDDPSYNGSVVRVRESTGKVVTARPRWRAYW